MAQNTLDFARTHYERITNWHKNAEIKAQIIIGLTGTFTALISTSILIKPTDISDIIAKFNIITIGLLTGAILSAIFGLIAAIISLWTMYGSYKPKQLQDDGNYDPKDMFFFGYIAKLDRENYVKSFKEIDEKKELEIYSNEIHVMSSYVCTKQNWTNYGFLSVVFSILFLLLASASYMISNTHHT